MSSVLEGQRSILTAFFHATGEPDWLKKAGWNTKARVENWAGVTVENDYVVKLDLPQKGLKGNIPPELRRLQNLVVLNLEFNNLSGDIPRELGDLKQLATLCISTKLSGNIPPDLGALENLQGLWLENNKLTGSIPPELGSLEKLEILFLDRNKLTGSIPPQLGKLSNLRELLLIGNNLEGNIPPELGGLKKLENLSLFDNKLTGSIPRELGGLEKLEDLNLSGNKLTGTIPPQLGELSHLRELHLSRNNLEGSIPPQLVELSNLRELRLYENSLGGSIPAELGGLEKLEKLSLSYNKLTGNIPPELGALQNLQVLWLENNKLTGSIPPELGSLEKLAVLGLDSNKLTGSIPPTLGDVKLHTLRLSNNQLIGDIPPALEGLLKGQPHAVRPGRRRDEKQSGAAMDGDHIDRVDMLGYGDYGESIADAVRQAVPPVAVGIYAKWGSGLYAGSDNLWAGVVKAMFDEVEKSSMRGNRRAHRIKRAVKSQGMYNFLLPLGICLLVVLIAVTARRSIDKGLATKLTVAFGTSLPVAAGLVAWYNIGWGVLGQGAALLKGAKDANFSKELGFMAKVKEELEDLYEFLRKEATVLAVMVDDLDRCKHSQVVSILEAAQLLLCMDNAPVALFLAVDPRVVTAAVEHSFCETMSRARITGYEYLEKLIQLPFCLPEIKLGYKRGLMDSILLGGTPEAVIDNLLELSLDDGRRLALEKCGVLEIGIKGYDGWIAWMRLGGNAEHPVPENGKERRQMRKDLVEAWVSKLLKREPALESVPPQLVDNAINALAELRKKGDRRPRKEINAVRKESMAHLCVFANCYIYRVTQQQGHQQQDAAGQEEQKQQQQQQQDVVAGGGGLGGDQHQEQDEQKHEKKGGGEVVPSEPPQQQAKQEQEEKKQTARATKQQKGVGCRWRGHNTFDSFVAFIDNNPRKMKRLANIYRVMRGVALKSNGDWDFEEKAIKWCILTEQWPYRTTVIVHLVEDCLRRTHAQKGRGTPTPGLGGGGQTETPAWSVFDPLVSMEDETQDISDFELIIEQVVHANESSDKLLQLDSDAELFWELLKTGPNILVEDIREGPHTAGKLMQLCFNLNPSLKDMVAGEMEQKVIWQHSKHADVSRFFKEQESLLHAQPRENMMTWFHPAPHLVPAATEGMPSARRSLSTGEPAGGRRHSR